MKKLLFTLLLTLLFVGCTNNKPYVEITYEEFVQKIDNNDNFIFYIGSSVCSFCDKFDVALKRVVDKYNVEVFYIDTYKMEQGDYDSLSNIVDYGGTPHTVFIKDGGISSRYNSIEGAVSSEKIIEAFKRNKYIK